MTQATARDNPTGAAGAAAGLMLIACLFLAAGAALAALLMIKLAVPVLFDAAAPLSYGRLRPAAYNLLVYGAGGVLAQAAAYYLLPRLTGAPLRWERAALLNGLAYAGLAAAGTVLVMFRGPSGTELSEFPPVIDWGLAACMLFAALLAVDIGRRRTGGGSYISFYYVLAALWWYPALYVIGSLPGLTGIGTFLQAGLVSGGALTVAFPAAALGAAYFTVVRDSGRPLFSGGLARAGFWTLAGAGLLAAPARYMSGPAPAWMESTTAVAAMGLGLSALAVAVNLAMTLHGGWEEARARPALYTTMAGVMMYAAVTGLTGLSGFRSVSAAVGLTTWQEGLDLGLVLAAVPLLGLGFVLYAFPRLTGREVFSARTAAAGTRLTLWGGAAVCGLLLAAGLVTGLSWNWANAAGALRNAGAGFGSVLDGVAPLYTLAAGAAVAAAAGVGVLAWSVARTYMSGEAAPVEMLAAVGAAEGPVGEDENE